MIICVGVVLLCLGQIPRPGNVIGACDGMPRTAVFHAGFFSVFEEDRIEVREPTLTTVPTDIGFLKDFIEAGVHVHVQ